MFHARAMGRTLSLSLLCIFVGVVGCDAPEDEDSNAAQEDMSVGGKADDTGALTITWHPLQTTGCVATAVVNDPTGNAYASSWLFQKEVARCMVSGSATLPAGVRVTQMFVRGRAFIAPTADVGGVGSAMVDVRGTRGQSLVRAEQQRVSAGEEGADIVIDGAESISTGCSASSQNFRYALDFAVGGETVAQFDSLDVAFVVEDC